MGIIEFFVLLLVAAVCGAVGSRIAGFTSQGCFLNIVLGFIGALIGTWLSRELHIHDVLYFSSIPIIWSIVGSALFVAAIALLTGKQRNRKK